MDFFGFGTGGIIVVLLLVLVLFGPGKVSETARTAGKYARALKKMSSEFTEAVSKEIGLDEDPRTTGSDLKPAGKPADISQRSDTSGPQHNKDEERPESVSSATRPKDAVDRTVQATAGERKE